jgi:hypothetical protein
MGVDYCQGVGGNITEKSELVELAQWTQIVTSEVVDDKCGNFGCNKMRAFA